MSDSSPLLLNMGAEAATAAGISPSQAPTSSNAAGGNAFAGVLQDAIAPTVKSDVNTPVALKPVEINPLLLSQLVGSGGEPGAENESMLDEMFGGKLLPSEEQDLALKAVLAEYDSEDPQSLRLVVAEGDEGGVDVKELTAEELLAATQSNEFKGPESRLTEGEEKQAHSQTILPDDINMADEKNPSPALTPIQAEPQQVPIRRSDFEQNNTEAKPIDSIETEPGLVTEKGRNTHTVKDPADNDVLNSQSASSDNDKAFEHLQAEQARLASSKAEQNHPLESLQSKSPALNGGQSSTISAATAYAAVSGIGPTNTIQHSTGSVIANLTVPPQNPAWGDIVGDRVHWMANQNIQEAKIRLNPPELGLLEVRVHIGHDQQTSISFSSPHSQVRDALETAVPRLREMFTDSGLSLGDVNISHQSMAGHGQNGQGEQRPASPNSGAFSIMDDPVESPRIQQLTSQGSGMLDLYA